MLVKVYIAFLLIQVTYIMIALLCVLMYACLNYLNLHFVRLACNHLSTVLDVMQNNRMANWLLFWMAGGT